MDGPSGRRCKPGKLRETHHVIARFVTYPPLCPTPQVTRHGLEYPQFYPRLYQLLVPEVGVG